MFKGGPTGVAGSTDTVILTELCPGKIRQGHKPFVSGGATQEKGGVKVAQYVVQ